MEKVEQFEKEYYINSRTIETRITISQNRTGRHIADVQYREEQDHRYLDIYKGIKAKGNDWRKTQIPLNGWPSNGKLEKKIQDFLRIKYQSPQLFTQTP